MQQLRNVVGNLKWASGEGDVGTTWLELYVLFRFFFWHAISERDTPLDSFIKYNSETKLFKRQMRNLKTFNLKPGDEWHLAPSMSRVNRLRAIGVTNMHVAIRGRIVLEIPEAKAVAREIVSLQGHIKSGKLEVKWNSGNHEVQMRPLYLNKVVPVFVPLNNRCNEYCECFQAAAASSVDCTQELAISSLHCPVCDFSMNASRFMLFQNELFSNVKCSRCRVTSSSRIWGCTCGMPWVKCSMHYPRCKFRRVESCSKVVRQRNLKRKFGEVKPPPKIAGPVYDIGISRRINVPEFQWRDQRCQHPNG